jgi:predicted nucleotidyltransferase
MQTPDLPPDVALGIDVFVAAAKAALDDDLASIVLFGSAAEGRMRATSDVNVLLVFTRFTKERVDKLREAFRLAHATIRLEAMLVLESELPAVAEAFAVKFGDIRARHRVLAGRDLVAHLQPSRAAQLQRVKQVLLNFILRSRERYAMVSLREEQLAPLVADAAGPLRAAAETILELEGRPAPSPKEALERLATELDAPAWREPLEELSHAREHGTLASGVAGPLLLRLVELAQALHGRSERIAS